MGKSESAGLHARDDGPAESEREVDSEPIPSTHGKPEGRRLTAAKGRAKRIYRRAVLDGSSLRREASLLGRHHSYLGALIDDGDSAIPSLAHVLAGSRDVRRAVGLQLQADADADPTIDALPVPLDQQTLLLQEDLGQLAGTMRRAMLDGRLDREELLALLEDGQRLVANGNALCAGVRKALDALDGAP